MFYFYTPCDIEMKHYAKINLQVRKFIEFKRWPLASDLWNRPSEKPHKIYKIKTLGSAL